MEKQIVGGTQFLVKLTFDILVSVLTEIGRSSKAYTELCGRTEVMVTDVLMALIDQGMQPQITLFIHVPMEFPIKFDEKKSDGPLYILRKTIEGY